MLFYIMRMPKSADSIADWIADLIAKSIADSNADSYTDVKCQQQKLTQTNQYFWALCSCKTSKMSLFPFTADFKTM